MFGKNRKSLVYLLILLVSFFLIRLKPELFVPLKSKVVSVLSLPISIVLSPFQEIKKLFLFHWTYDQYQKLQKENEALKARLIGLQEVSIENQRYEKLLEFKRDLIFSSVTANVIGRDPSNWNAVILIDKGEHDGIHAGMPVVNYLGVIGKVAEVSSGTSKVIFLTDPNFSVAALVQRSREGGLISGSLQGLCRMRYLDPHADIKIGDVIVTSRLSSSFPEGLFIGEVVTIQDSKNSPGVECMVNPAVSSSQIEEVIIIKK